jgi:hypothetical protein
MTEELAKGISSITINDDENGPLPEYVEEEDENQPPQEVNQVGLFSQFFLTSIIRYSH